MRSFYPVEENEEESDVNTRQESAYISSDSVTTVSASQLAYTNIDSNSLN